MRDFVVERDLALARLTARMVEDGLAHGVVGADGQGLPAWMSLMVGDQIGMVLVTDGEGRVLVHPDPQQVGANLGTDPGVVAALEQHEGAVIVTGKDDEPVLIAFAPVGGTNWAVLIQEPVEGLIGPILRLSSLAPVVAVGAGILSLLVLTFGYRTIVRPLQRLSQATEQVSWGDYSAISTGPSAGHPVGGVQEVRDLHQALAEMVRGRKEKPVR